MSLRRKSSSSHDRPHGHGLQDLKTAVIKQEKRVQSSLCSIVFLVTSLKTICLVLFYYSFSIGITFYNQHLFQHNHQALSITMCHLIFKFILAFLIRQVLECKNQVPRVTLSWSDCIKRVALAGCVSSLDIGLSNWSFEMITVSLYTMSKTTAVIFILFFSLMFKLEKFRWSLLFVVFFIFTGLFLFTFRSTQFNLKGFILVMTASVLSGLRWTLAQMVLQKNEIGLHNPIDMMYHIQPWMILSLLPLSAGIELQEMATSDQYFRFSLWSVLLTNVGYVLIGAALGFMLEFSEFLLLSYTSSLTLSISSILKEICVLGLAILINNDKITLINGVGLVICFVGVMVHVCSKAIEMNEKSKHNRHFTVEARKMLTKKGFANDSSEDEVELFSFDRDR
ncbi:solute carrier family 35 member C2-like isoform X1 [Biomphalaria glabrata]|uniref:Solute carrier family 35 member C2-like isoform X1 n=1 Tax=Biomphalaria glabrata TaxID=6526 RepID=A0A9U8EAG0_BIOGL|nr:solute carrier family 35 member C2-like isoform X1 [Biomphalaria glabrata]